MKSALKNLVLVFASICFAIVLTLAADRIFGWLAPPPTLPGVMELIFPPNAEQSYRSVDFSYTAHINSLGIRDEEIPKERGNKYRIIAIGDSYTYGWGVAHEETWLHLLEKQLQEAGLAVETLNLGKPGAGPPFYAEVAERAIPILRPDLVLVGILQGNDLAGAGPELLEEAKAGALEEVRRFYPNLVRFVEDRALMKDYAERTQERPPQKSSAEDNRRWAENTAKEFLDKMSAEHRAKFDAFDPEVKEAYLQGLLNPYMIDLAMQNPRFNLITLNLDDPWIQSCIDRMAGRLAAIKQIAEKYGARVAVLSIPDGPFVNREAYEGIQRVGYEMEEIALTSPSLDQGIQRAAERAGLPFFTTTQAFRDRIDDPTLYFPLDGHMTPQGHALYAEGITPQIQAFIQDQP